jgi:hypothetical protein
MPSINPSVLSVPSSVGLSEKLPRSNCRISELGKFFRIWEVSQARRARPPEGFFFQPQGSTYPTTFPV